MTMPMGNTQLIWFYIYTQYIGTGSIRSTTKYNISNDTLKSFVAYEDEEVSTPHVKIQLQNSKLERRKGVNVERVQRETEKSVRNPYRKKGRGRSKYSG